MREKSGQNSTPENHDLFDFVDDTPGNCILMNSWRQWPRNRSNQHYLNNTIDGFYADHDKEYEEEPTQPTQLMSTAELNMLNNSNKRKRTPVVQSFSSPSDQIEIPPINSSSAAAAAADSSNKRSKLTKSKDDYDPYLELHHTCTHARGTKGMSILADNYVSVMHALACEFIARNMGVLESSEKYLNAYNNAAVNVANNGRVLLGNAFNVFARLPDMKIPAIILPQLELSDENYSCNKKVKSKAKNAKAAQEESDTQQKVLIGILFNVIKCFNCILMYNCFFRH
jgi:hypothetical protein